MLRSPIACVVSALTLVALVAAGRASAAPGLSGLHVRLTDAASGETYDARIPVAITPAPAGFTAYTSSFPSAAIELTVQVGQRPDGTECRVTAVSASHAMRDVSIEISVPGAETASRLWMPADGFPMNITPSVTRNYRADFQLPIVTAYTPGVDKATALIMPFDGKYPFLQMGCKDGRLFTRTTNLRLQAGHNAFTAAWIARTAPDWRPALGWALHRFPATFKGTETRPADGPMILGSLINETDLKYLAALGFKWSESDLLQTSSYGDYMEHASDPKVVAQIQDYLARAKSSGIQVFGYWQALECRPDEAAKRFPGCRFQRADGSTPAEGWKGQYVWMAPVDGSPWQSYIVNQMARMVKLLPDVSGMFCDNNLFNGFSYGQDDGVTAARGERDVFGSPETVTSPSAVRPVCQQAIAQAETLGKVRTLLGGKQLWVNLTADAATIHNVDGVLVETLRFMSEKYVGLDRPMDCITYYDKPDPDSPVLRSNLQQILLAGMQPGFNEADVRKLDGPILRGYLPLFHELLGRSWVLDPHPIHATWSQPAELQSQVFRRPDGACVAIVGSGPEDTGDVQVQLRLASWPRSHEAYLRRSADNSWTPVQVAVTRDAWSFTIPAHSDTSMVVIGAKPQGMSIASARR